VASNLRMHMKLASKLDASDTWPKGNTNNTTT